MFKSNRWRLLIGFIATSGTLTLAARAIQLPAAEFWKDRPGTIVALVALAAVGVGALNANFEAVRSSLRERREEMELALRPPLVALFRSLMDELGSEHYVDVAVHCFLLRRKLRPEFPWFQKELVRVGGFQLKTSPRSAVRWTKGKGLIGECWASNKDAGANLEEEWAEYREYTAIQWDRLPPRTRYAMSFPEYDRTRAYAAIVATPIQNGKEAFVGCISVDSTGPSYELLWSTREKMQSAAQSVAKALKLS